MQTDSSMQQVPVIGVMGGSFNPIHLGHVLLAVTVRETKPVDEVVVVPVFKHPVKTDLLPFEDRLAMCELALRGKGITVSAVEQETGESNVVMLQALRQKYTAGCQLFWVCGDDVFEWIESVKGQAMMKELDGLIVQRRLHRVSGDNFHKSPLDTAWLAAFGERNGLKIDVIFGELPHFSSTLVRNSPTNWTAYLPSLVTAYLEARPHLLAKVLASAMGAAPDKKCEVTSQTLELTDVSGKPLGEQTSDAQEAVTACAMRCIQVIHGLQRERGCTAVAFSTDSTEAKRQLLVARGQVDALLHDLPQAPLVCGPAHSLVEELSYTHRWLANDRKEYDMHLQDSPPEHGDEDLTSAWLRRVVQLRKFNARIDVLIEASYQLLQTKISPRGKQALPANLGADGAESESECLFRLYCVWARGKEALGRERAFVAAGGKDARGVVRSSLRVRSNFMEVIEQKEIMLGRILSMEQAVSTPRYQSAESEALHRMLTRITAIEWSLLGCFASRTPQHVQIKIVSGQAPSFNVEDWFETTSSAIDLMLTLVQGLAAGICITDARTVS